jgi:hypothetical protein
MRKGPEWVVDGRVKGITGYKAECFLWPLSGGTHEVYARVWVVGGESPLEPESVRFHVK